MKTPKNRAIGTCEDRSERRSPFQFGQLRQRIAFADAANGDQSHELLPARAGFADLPMVDRQRRNANQLGILLCR